MTCSTLISHVQPQPEAAPRLARALDLARRFGARLIGVGAETIAHVPASQRILQAALGLRRRPDRARLLRPLPARRVVFGGVTRDLLAQDEKTYLLLSRDIPMGFDALRRAFRGAPERVMIDAG
jgi:hypothetical protein